MEPGIYAGISNEDYHQDPAYSKSQLDFVRQAPGLLQWSKRAPSTGSVADHMGTALHCLLLEPDEFGNRFVVGPDTGRTAKPFREFEKELPEGWTGLTKEEDEKLIHMYDSVMAHPDAAALMSMDGESELSCWYIDEATGLPCRFRPDWWIRSRGIMVDVKSTDIASKFQWSVRDFRYDVQQAFYSDGAAALDEPVDDFLFLVVGKTREMGKYPVRLIALPPMAVERGRAEYREDLQTIVECQRSGEWSGVEILNPPQRVYY